MNQKNKFKEEIKQWLVDRYEEYKEINRDFKDIQYDSLKKNYENITLI